MALALASASFAQGEKPPVSGTYYSAKDFDWRPPLPFNPHPDLPAVEFEPGKFLVDDTGLPDTPEQAEARRRHRAARAGQGHRADPVLAAAAHRRRGGCASGRSGWQNKKAALRRRMRALDSGRPADQSAETAARRSGIRGLARAGRTLGGRAASQRARALDELAKHLNTPREIEIGRRKLILTGELADSPDLHWQPEHGGSGGHQCR